MTANSETVRLAGPCSNRPAARREFPRSAAAALLIGACLSPAFFPVPSFGGDTYWHFTLQAVIDEGRAEEWLWVTMVERTKEQVFPDTAGKVKGMGGVFPGTVLANVRGAAWRSDFAYEKDRKCKGRPSKIGISWKSSWSNQVYAHGKILEPTRDSTGRPYLFDFVFGLADEHQKVLMEDGQWRDLRDLVTTFVGPIAVGGEREEWQGKVQAQGISYEDMLVHYRYCGQAWAEQARTPLLHYAGDNLRSGFGENPDSATGTESYKFNGHSVMVIYHIERTSSREHPQWKRKLASASDRR